MAKPVSPVLTAQITAPRFFTESSVGPAWAAGESAARLSARHAQRPPSDLRNCIGILLQIFDFSILFGRMQGRQKHPPDDADAITAPSVAAMRSFPSSLGAFRFRWPPCKMRFG